MTDEEYEQWLRSLRSGKTAVMPPGNPRRRAVQHEAMEQEALFDWAKATFGRYPELKLLYHIPNGGKRNRFEAAHLKRQGVKAGVPDICLPVPRGGFHGLYIELKAGSNKPTDSQNKWLSALRAQGYAAEVCVGWKQAQELITEYLGMRGTNNEHRVI